ncbi:MAG: hypothetical protein H7834_11645 [Magnetococcus sp. YQC-9]
MSETVVREEIDVRQLFQESERYLRALFAETDRRLQEQREESDRRYQEQREENERRYQEQREKNERLYQEQRKETERQLQERMQETDRKIKEVSRQIGHLGGRLGEFIEEMIKPVCIRLFQERGIPVDEVYGRVNKVVGGERMEIDLLLANTVAAVLIEVKSHLTAEDVQTHLDRLARFKRFFPRYGDCRIYGAVAGMVIGSEADRFAINQGLYVIAQTGEQVALANPEAFEPRVW